LKVEVSQSNKRPDGSGPNQQDTKDTADESSVFLGGLELVGLTSMIISAFFDPSFHDPAMASLAVWLLASSGGKAEPTGA
jgi:acyl-CoA synthetase (NDP forming)